MGKTGSGSFRAAATKNWGMIRKINLAKRSRKESPRQVEADPPAETETEEVDPHEPMEEVDPEDFEAQGGGGVGKGTAIQDGVSFMRHIPLRKHTFIYEHRQEWKMRNRIATPWTVQNLITAGTDPVQPAISLRNIITDEHCIPSHVMDFYMTRYEMLDFRNPRWRTFQIHEAGFEIEHVQVVPNVVQGGTDLRYAAPMGINPLAYCSGTKSREFPFYMLQVDPQTGVPPQVTDPITTQLPGFADNIARSKEDSANAYAIQRGYFLMANNASGTTVGLSTIPQFEGTYNYRLKRDWDIMPVTDLVGYKHMNKTWTSSFPMPASQQIGNLVHNFAYNEGVHDISTNLLARPTSTDTGNVYRRAGAFADVRDRPSAPDRIFMTDNVLGMFPVGPLWNNVYKQVSSANGSVIPGKGDNMPWCFAQQNVLDPEGLPFDYTTRMTLVSKLVITYDTDHTAGNSNANASVLNPGTTFAWPSYDGVAHHFYGQGALSGILNINDQNLAQGAKSPVFNNYLKMFGTNVDLNLSNSVGNANIRNNMLNQTEVVRDVVIGDNLVPVVPTRVMTRSMTKKQCNND